MSDNTLTGLAALLTGVPFKKTKKRQNQPCQISVFVSSPTCRRDQNKNLNIKDCVYKCPLGLFSV